ncbi:MAG: sulfatase [Phycisphaerae bacterium]|nr:sulfatase [Phycisphaerae bacterium]
MKTTNLTRRRFLKALGGAAATSGVRPVVAASSAGKRWRRNVVFVCLDTTRADHLGCYGYSRGASPNLDRLAQRSVVFDDVLSPSSWTLPVLASVMTGLYPHEHGAIYFRTPIRDGVVRLPEILRQGGLSTAAIGQFPFHFDFYKFQVGFDLFAQKWSQTASKTTAQALRYLSERAGREEGFFLWVHYFEPHVPYEWQFDSAGFYEKGYRGKTLKVFDANLILKLEAEGTPRADAELKRIIDLYDGEIHCADKYLGWVLDELGRRKLVDETMVIVMADHGEHFGEHGIVEHGNSLYEEAVRVPLVIHAPGCRPGRCGSPVSLVDVFATILDFLGLPARETSGCSLMPALAGEAPPERTLFTTLDTVTSVIFVPDGRDPSKIQTQDKVIHDLKAVRRGRKKLILDARSGKYALYDLAVDPGERRDLLVDGKPPGDLRGALDEWITAMQRYRPTVAAPDASVIEAMRSLGYIQ